MLKLFLIFLLAVSSSQAQTGRQIVDSARRQIGVTVGYDPSYTTLKYPGGDVPAERGVCTDVVIRALRDGLGKDLQQLVHEDMARNFSAYPKNWGLAKPDRNIDHRRVPNLQAWFKRKGHALLLTPEKDANRFLPGDLVTCTVPPHLPHIMIVSDKKTAEGVPWVIHNIGGGAREENVLFTFPLTGHYRLK
jgi:uncharacterized protein YijF (DUF1287 family)